MNQTNPPDWLSDAIQNSLQKVGQVLERQSGPFLHATKNGVYQEREPQWWTSGFWPGILWQAYRYTKNEKFAEAARPAAEKLAACFLDERFYGLHHDVGFQFLLTAVAGYSLTGEPADKQRGLLAACFEMSRFVPDGRFLRAWNAPGSAGNSIIDSMMNLPLLLWASREIQDNRFAQVALAHADTVRERIMRPDGSVPHIVHFEPGANGQVNEWAEGAQAFSIGSVWARGQAWAIYGFAQMARFSGEARFAEASQRVADNYLKLLGEYGSFVPPWDFHAPAGQARDSSAASCAASGLLELASLPGLSKDEQMRYREAAVAMLQSLHQECANWNNSDEALLREGTEHYPVGRNVNTGLIYGDYYFIEALLKLAGCGLIYG